MVSKIKSAAGGLGGKRKLHKLARVVSSFEWGGAGKAGVKRRRKSVNVPGMTPAPAKKKKKKKKKGSPDKSDHI